MATADRPTDAAPFPHGIEIVVSALIRNPQDEILLVRQPRWGEIWTLPGGHLEPGETLEHGARREGMEETGLALSEGRLIAWGELIDRESFTESIHLLYFDFSYRVCATDLHLDGDEIAEARWVAPAQALTMKLSNGYRTTIEKFLRDDRGEPKDDNR